MYLMCSEDILGECILCVVLCVCFFSFDRTSNILECYLLLLFHKSITVSTLKLPTQSFSAFYVYLNENAQSVEINRLISSIYWIKYLAWKNELFYALCVIRVSFLCSLISFLLQNFAFNQFNLLLGSQTSTIYIDRTIYPFCCICSSSKARFAY